MSEEFKKRKTIEKMEKEMKEKNYIKKQDESDDLSEKPKLTDKVAMQVQTATQEEPYVPDFDLDELPDLE